MSVYILTCCLCPGAVSGAVSVSCIGCGAGLLSVFRAGFGQKCQNWEELLEKFKITNLGSGLKAVPLKVTSNVYISEADITLFCNLFGIIIFLSHALFFAPVFQKPCITEEWLCPICVQICVHSDLAMIKLLPGQKGLQGLFTTPSGCRAVGCSSGHLPSCSSGLLHGGKWVTIPFLQKGIAEHRVVLLERRGKCLGTAFWWKWLC